MISIPIWVFVILCVFTLIGIVEIIFSLIAFIEFRQLENRK